MARHNKIKKVSLAVQAFNLKKMFPKSCCRISRNSLTWQADLTPSTLSKVYKILLRYRINKGPDIHVIKPELIAPKGKRLPHSYSGKRLCLYFPGSGEWRGDLILVKTIVPWISEWLVNYEIWLATGSWCGGGIHPSDGKKNR